MIEKEKLDDAVICKKDDSSLEVSRIMRDTQTRHVIVVDNGLQPLGIISAFDINNRVVAEEKDAKNVKAVDIMTKPIESVDIKMSYDEAYRKMIDLSVYTIPVIDEGKLVGILDFNFLFKKLCGIMNGGKKK